MVGKPSRRNCRERIASTNKPIPEQALAQTSVPVGSVSRDRRIALVIGNSKYKNAPLLPNPQRDATMVADALKRTGFSEVTLQTDLGKEALSAALQTFMRAAQAADWAVVYYAGHGMEIGGINYLIPVDALLETDKEVQFQAVPLNQVLDVVGGASKLRCRFRCLSQQSLREQHETPNCHPCCRAEVLCA